jgi:hypothetical protein
MTTILKTPTEAIILRLDGTLERRTLDFPGLRMLLVERGSPGTLQFLAQAVCLDPLTYQEVEP